jgi:actin-like ATPase involved in cell morphogenesis
MARWFLGVDLGTSFSAGATAIDGKVDILEVGGERRIPSTVLLNEAGILVAGRVAQRSMLRAPERVERNPKRYVGRSNMLLGGVSVDVKDAMAAILELFVAEGRTRFDGAPPAGVVLTCPVAWREDRRAVLMAAGRKVVPDARISLVEEPVASALHYAATQMASAQNVSAHGTANHAGGNRVAVYDLGGGTFDAAVLAADGAEFSVVGEPGGDDMIGGEVFDERVFAFLGAQLERSAADWWAEVSGNPDRRYRAAAADLLEEARAAKETLSAYDTASQYVAGADVDVEISRADLDALVAADIVRTEDILEETLNRSRVDRRQLTGIFITGGASRMPLVHETLRARHGDLVRTYDDPKIVVALGAARMAWTLWMPAGDKRVTAAPPKTGSPPAGPMQAGPLPVESPTSEPPTSEPPRSEPPRSEPQRFEPPTSEPPRSEPPRSAPQRFEPPTSEPPRSEPPRSEPQRFEPPRSEPQRFEPPRSAPQRFEPPKSGPIPSGPQRSEPLTSGKSTSELFRTVLDDVIGVHATVTGTYALCADANRHFVRRLDLATGTADREVPFGQVLDWAAGDEGLLLAERGPAGTVVRTLTPELVIRSTQALPAVPEVRTLARGATGWAFYRNAPATAVDHSNGLPWGETGDLTVMELSLSGFFGQEAARLPLGSSAQWFVNEDNIRRRLFDQDSPTGSDPALAHGSAGCTLVLGQFSSKTAMFQNVHQGFQPWQILCVVDPGGRIHRIERRSPHWLQQVVLHDSKWFVSTSAGLEIDAPPSPPRLVAPRPRAGALRWFPAGREMYAIGMDTVLPARGWSVSYCDRQTGTLRTLAQESGTALLGHLTSRVRAERPRVIADGDSLWMGVAAGRGRSRILHVTPAGVREALTAPGWVEPVAIVPEGLLCLHRRDEAAPGIGQARPARLRLLSLPRG